jgi:gluconate 2-dehydrogenase alpha chain
MERYGAKQLVDGLIVQDWGVTYDELEPFYDRFEKIAGTSGTAGVINGVKKPGGTPSKDRAAANIRRLRWFAASGATSSTRRPPSSAIIPSRFRGGTIGAPYKNPLGVNLAPCTYCGYCQLYGCGNWSKSSPNACIMPALKQRSNFTVLTECEVLHINKTRWQDGDGRHLHGLGGQ